MKLDRSRIWSLEDYAAKRPAFRAEVIAHKKLRRVALGPHATLVFEDFTTMKYQVQEMLRVERIFEAAGDRGRDRRLQPADSRRRQLESDVHDRVRRRRRTARSARDDDRPRTPRVGEGRRYGDRCSQSRTKTCRAATTKRRRPCISCASICRRRRSQPPNPAQPIAYRHRSSGACPIASIRFRKPIRAEVW